MSPTCDAPQATLSRRLAAGALGTGFLLIAVVGSGILGERLSGGGAGLTLLVNALATAAASIEQHPGSRLIAGQSVDFIERHRDPQFLEPVQKFVDQALRAHRKSRDPHPLG
jgi:hypothetical protein